MTAQYNVESSSASAAVTVYRVMGPMLDSVAVGDIPQNEHACGTMTMYDL